MSTALAEHMGAEQPGMPVKHVSLCGNMRRLAGGLIEQQIDKLSSPRAVEDDYLDAEVLGEEALPLPTYADAGVHYLRQITQGVFGTRERTEADQQGTVPLEVLPGKVNTGKTAHEYTLFRRENRENNGRFIYILSGLTASEAAYEPLAKELAKLDEAVVTSQEARGGRPNTDKRNYTAPEEIASEGAFAVANEIMQKYGFNRVVFVCHSLGGGTGTDLALRMHELVESKADLESLGVDDATFLGMALRTGDSLVKEFAPAIPKFAMSAHGRKLGLETFKRTALRPVRFAVEATHAGRANYRPQNEELRRIAPHMGQLALHGAKSAFFPIERTRENAGDLYHELIEHPHPDANHLFPQLYPITTARAILDGLEKVNKREGSPGSSEPFPQGELVAA